MADPSLTILFLDDSQAQLDDVASVLKQAGHTVRTATTLPEALAGVHGADLILIDFYMPDVDGAKAMHALRESLQSDTPVAFYLYTSDRGLAVTYKALGFDGAFTGKGDSAALPEQVQAAHRMLQLRRFRHERQRA